MRMDAESLLKNRRIEIIGGAEGDRTPGLMTASHALSQLSYSPTCLERMA